MERVDRRIFHALAGWGWRIASAGLLVLAGALAPAGQARAQTTTAADAEKAAGSWLKSRPRPLGAALGVEVASVKTYKDDRSEPVYHVVSLKSGGFLIVPAEDLVEPVVCFSPKGSFDPSERNPLGALADRDLRGRVKDARGREAAARGAGRELVPAGRMASAKRKWDRLRGGSSESAAAAGTEAGTGTISDPRVDALVQSKWDQEQVAGVDCYNYYTPGNYVCGCVATAMAQLMRFHQHPTAGVGTTSFSIEVNGTPTTRSLRGGNGSGGAYSWAQMVLIPSAGMTLTQRQAIGALTHDAGVSVNMSYTMLGSGADTLMAANRLTGTFGYANAIRGYNGGADLGAGLNGMLNPGLDAGLPSLLGITGPDGGHAIVCDGYGYDSSTLYHHLNMGWSGLDDAWYNLPDIGTTGFEFNTVYKCIYNVYPSGTGEIVSGRVTDAGGLPLSGVSISAVRSGGGTYTATTNARGIYALARIPSGSSYTVSASKDGYTFSSQAVSTGTSAHNAATSGNYWGLNFTPAGGSPVLALSPGALSFSAQIGVNPDAKGAVVTNTGTGTLRWSAWSDKPWLQVAPTWGTTTIESDALAVSAVVAQTESWSATATAGAAAAREDHSAVWTGREMIIWGGNTDYAHNPTNTGAKYDPAADAWTGTVSTTGAPSGRRRHSAAWTGSEMIVWGGWDLTNSYLADGYRYNPVTDAWSSGVTATNAPSARRSHTAVWTGSEMIVWGGQVAGDGVTNTGARYNPTANTWTAVTTTGAPTARRDHVAVWTGTEMIVWGGMDGGGGTLKTGAKYNPATNTWSAVASPGGLVARNSARAAWTGSEMIVWGGHNGSADVNTGSRYDPVGDTWVEGISTAGAPTARHCHSGVWTGTEAVFWGGWGGAFEATGGRFRPGISLGVGSYVGTVTVTDPVASGSPRTISVSLQVQADVPPAIGLSPLSLAFSTSAGSNPSDKTIAVTNTGGGTLAWTASGDKPWLRASPTWGATTVETDTLTVSAVASQAEAWTGTTNPSGAPTAREDHSQIWTGKEMIAWGGRIDVGGTSLNTGARYDPATDTWTGTTTATGAPTGRRLHSAVWTGSEMIVWGGVDSSEPVWTYYNQGYRYDPKADSWTGATSTTGAPTARRSHSAVWTGSEMIIWGGETGGDTPTATGARYNPVANTWTAVSTTNAPAARWHHCAVWTGSEMIVWGGTDGTNKLNTGARYSPATDTWTAVTATSGAPTGRWGACSAWTGSEMIVWGGNDGSGLLANGMRYDPAADSWTGAVASSGAPAARCSGKAVWTGAEVIVWGGNTGSYSNTGGRYRPPISLAVGTYTGTLTVADPNATNNPRSVLVTLTVESSSGTAKGWGSNAYGELGDGTITGRKYPVATLPPVTDAMQLAAGEYHTVALLANGDVKVWGRNNCGQLGNNTTATLKSPPASPVLTGVRAVAAGGTHTLALMENGTVMAWGGNKYGQLGDGTKVNRKTPVYVLGLSNVAAIAAGRNHSVAVLASGEVRAWGNNSSGQLGDGTTTLRVAPVAVFGLSGATSASAGIGHTAVLKSDGTVMTWGLNSSGQLGNMTTTTSKVPVAVPGISTAAMVRCGGSHTVALLADGTVMAWGANKYGQLGLGTTVTAKSPVAVPGLSGAEAVAAGWSHTLALLESGELRAWGANGSGQLGTGNTVSSKTPVTVLFLTDGIAVDAGANRSAAVEDP